MSQENVEATGETICEGRNNDRTIDQRLAVRFPRLAVRCLRLLSRLPRESRLRSAALRRSVRLTSDAYNRRDLDAVVIGFHPQLEYLPGREWVKAGLVEPCYRGPQGYRRYVLATMEVWGGHNYFDPVRVVDLGDRFLVLAHVRMRGQGSGIPLVEEYAYIATLRDGLVARLQEFFDHDEALEAAGLSE